jgi:hypothetical protein
MATRSVSKLLGDAAEFRPLQERLEVIERLQQRYRTLVPGDLAKASRVCAIDDSTVVVSAANGPVAAALRQLAPRVLSGLRQTPEGERNSLNQNEIPELTGMRVEVQVERKAARRAVKPREPLPAEKLSQLAQGLADSPLKDALEAIGRKAQSRRTREKT